MEHCLALLRALRMEPHLEESLGLQREPLSDDLMGSYWEKSSDCLMEHWMEEQREIHLVAMKESLRGSS